MIYKPVANGVVNGVGDKWQLSKNESCHLSPTPLTTPLATC